VLNDWCNINCVDENEILELERLGYGKNNDTNDKLDNLLDEHLNLSRKDVYITNAFPYLKPGALDKKISGPIMSWSIKEFLIPQIEIIKPKFVICLGYSGIFIRKILFKCKEESILKCINSNNNMDKYVKTKSIIFCQYHPGVRPVNATPEVVNKNWTKMVKIINNGSDNYEIIQ